MTLVTSTITFHAPADTVWQVIGDLRAAGLYLSMVVNCTVEGAGVGALRTLTNTPFRNCLTTMAVRDLGPSQSELEWSATFEADRLPASEAAELMEGALAANCLALKQFMEAGYN